VALRARRFASDPAVTNAATPADPTRAEDVPPLPQPWRADSRIVEPAPRRAGCALPAVLGCGCLTVLSGVGFFLMVSNARGLVEWQLRPLRRAVQAGLPREVSESERRRFEAAFDALPEALTSGRLDAGTVWRFQRQLAETAAAAQAATLDREGAMALLTALERIVSSAAAEPAPARPPAAEGVEASRRFGARAFRWTPVPS